MRQVVQALERGHQVVGAEIRGGGDVGVVHADPVGQAGRGDVAPGQLDRGGVEVIAVHAHHRVASGQADARPAGAAADVGHPGRRGGAQPLLDSG